METDDRNLEPEEDDSEEMDEYPEGITDEYFEKQDERYKADGYIKVAEGQFDEFDTWYDSKIESHFYEIQDIIHNIKRYLDISILDNLFRIVMNWEKYQYNSRWCALDEISGVEIITMTPDDRFVINMLYPVCYVKRSQLKSVYKEYGKLVRQFKTQMKKNGYFKAIDKIVAEENRKKLEQETLLRKKKEEKLAIEAEALAEKEKEEMEFAELQLSKIAAYFLNPVTPYYCIGPTLCTIDGKILIITHSQMYNFHYSKIKNYSMLISHIRKFYECIGVHEGFHNKYAFHHYSPESVPTGWNYTVGWLRCYDRPEINAETIRADYIKWRAEIS